MGMNSDAFNDFIELFFLWDGMFDVDKQELGAQVWIYFLFSLMRTVKIIYTYLPQYLI